MAVYVIKPASNGITLSWKGQTVAWRLCDQPSASEVQANSWAQGFAMATIEASTSDSLGDSIMLSCQDGADGTQRTQAEAAGFHFDAIIADAGVSGVHYHLAERPEVPRPRPYPLHKVGRRNRRG